LALKVSEVRGAVSMDRGPSQLVFRVPGAYHFVVSDNLETEDETGANGTCDVTFRPQSASESPESDRHSHGVFALGPGVSPPQLKHRVPIATPEDLLGQRLEQRTTIIEVVVDEHGKVRDPKVIASSYPSFDQATVDAVRLWEYEPGRKDGRKVPVRLTISASPELR
jgi:TonB family protein